MLSEGIPILRVGNLFTSNHWYYSDLDLDPDKYIDDGDLIYAWSASFGPFIWNGGKVIYHYHIWKMDLYSENALDKCFSKLFLAAISERIKASGNGIVMIHMTKERMEKVIHPLPPIEEQHRIVAKVDELMVLCDQLEQQTESSFTAHNTLVEVLLTSLTDSYNADELKQNWARISAFLDMLFTTEHSIEQLKQCILQLAVMGKLVPQNPDDEPAAKLLERIAAEKAQLIADKKIKKQKALAPISDEEKPFELPDGWEWCRFGCVAVTRLGKMLDKAKNIGKPLPYLWNTNVQWHKFVLDDIKLMKFEDYELEEFFVRIDDLLICEGGEPGRCAIWSDPEMKIYFQKAIHRARALVGVLTQYLQLCLTVDASNGVLDCYFTGATIKHFVGAKLNSYTHSLPPLAEQHRIVAKVDELMALCEQLKSRLNAAQQTQLQLADAIIDKAI